MLGFLKNLFDYNQQQLKRYKKIVEQINALESEVRALPDKDFVRKTEELKENVQSGKKTLDDILPFAYALVREAARRVLGERHYDVQLMAGIALHEGKIAEQKTGEGKTLSATTALYLNALTGKGVHLVTVNDYLARRDCGWMGVVFHFLGLKTSAIISNASFVYDPEFFDEDAQDWRLMHLRPVSRKEAYTADITYGINSEFGFDYLRDNMVRHKSQMVQRGFYYVIIDEADSILIDEARTPLIISAPYEEDVSKYYEYAKLVQRLEPETDYLVDEKMNTAHLTDKGISKIENYLGVKNLYEKDFNTLYHIEAALKAKALYKKDKDYIVKDGQVVIVDEFTGRLLEGRRFSEGLHQAIEAKEGVEVQKESKTLATISIQNYFRQYEKLAGMTGTAATEAEEFNKIYKADVVVIPTHRPVIRRDRDDLIYKTQKAKFKAVVDEVARAYAKGRPVLVGTTSIEKNEYLSSLLKKKGIPHNLLNAKNHEKEAYIISQAGKKGSITVATNMAGRGVDIVLGGEPPSRHMLKTRLLKAKSEKERKSLQERFNKEYAQWEKRHKQVLELGGLYVIGTEKHESRRIDNQLRGRAGRQGDPGESRFFVSLEDDLMRIFGGEQISRVMNMLKMPEDQPIEHSMVSKVITQAQIKVEGFNFDIRKTLVEFDDVLNKQREIVYDIRNRIISLSEEDKTKFDSEIYTIVQEHIDSVMNNYFVLAQAGEVSDELMHSVFSSFPFVQKSRLEAWLDSEDQQQLREKILEEFRKLYKSKGKKYSDIWREVVKTIFLDVLDRFWMDHLTAVESLREGIGLRRHAQIDPLVEYKNEAYKMFENLLSSVYAEFVKRISFVQVEAVDTQEKEQEMEYKAVSTSVIDMHKSQKAKGAKMSKVAKKKLGRNDPCWCGSGKKYKKCHYPN